MGETTDNDLSCQTLSCVISLIWSLWAVPSWAMSRYPTMHWSTASGPGFSLENPSRIPVSVSLSVRFTFEAANYGRSDCDSLLHLADKRICCDEKINACPLFSCWIIIALHILILGAESSVGHWCTRHTKITWLISEWRLSPCHLLEPLLRACVLGLFF